MGQTVEIKSWNKYNAGLPTASGMTKYYSEGENINSATECKGVYTELEDVEIMFHTAPLIPARAEDPQKVRIWFYINSLY